MLDYLFRLKNVIEQNRGHIKAANVLQRYHNSRLERLNTLEKENVLEMKNKKNTGEKETKETKDVKLSESHKSHLANFRFTKLFLDLFYNIYFRFQRMAVGAKGNVRISSVYMKQNCCQRNLRRKRKYTNKDVYYVVFQATSSVEIHQQRYFHSNSKQSV